MWRSSWMHDLSLQLDEHSFLLYPETCPRSIDSLQAALLMDARSGSIGGRDDQLSLGRTTSASASMKAGRSLNDAVRLTSTRCSAAHPCASTSRSYRIS